MAPPSDPQTLPIDAWAILGETDVIPRLHETLSAFGSAPNDEQLRRATQILLEQHEEIVGRLGDLDGALVLDRDLKLIGAGAKLATSARPLVLDADQGSEPLDLELLGGTRHQSAARFVGQVHDAFAVVLSADGPVTLFAYVEKEGAVVRVRKLEWVL